MTSYPTAKWILDKTASAALLVLLSPVFAFLFVVIGLEMLLRPRDRGPWLYREPRISRGRAFDEENLTWAGRRLLKPWYLDELPQIWNVLRGDMSLVGPRPWPPSMVATQVARGLSYRNEFVAGWTGPAQVQKGVTEPAGYAELDLAYLDAARMRGSLSLVRADIGILWKTVRVMARGEGLEF